MREVFWIGPGLELAGIPRASARKIPKRAQARDRFRAGGLARRLSRGPEAGAKRNQALPIGARHRLLARIDVVLLTRIRRQIIKLRLGRLNVCVLPCAGTSKGACV